MNEQFTDTELELIKKAIYEYRDKGLYQVLSFRQQYDGILAKIKVMQGCEMVIPDPFTMPAAVSPDLCRECLKSSNQAQDKMDRRSPIPDERWDWEF